MVTWAPLPDLAAWLRDASRQIPFVLALVDHEGGDVTTYSSDDMEPAREASVGERSKYEHKVRGGGWSHLNWQRSAETIWAQNAAEVAAEIERQARSGPELVILAGDVHSRGQVIADLPDTIAAEEGSSTEPVEELTGATTHWQMMSSQHFGMASSPGS